MWGIDLSVSKNLDLATLAEDIIDIDPKMRFVAIIKPNGAIAEAIMKSGKTSLKSQKEEIHFCKQVAKRRKMRKEFDSSLGKARYVHVEREKVTQMVVYPKKHTVYFTMEPELRLEKKLQIVTKIKKLTAHL